MSNRRTQQHGTSSSAAQVGNATLGLPSDLTPPTWTPPPNWPVPQFTGDEIADVVANSLQAAEAECQLKNNEAIQQYYNAMNSFWINVNSGRVSNANAPNVPLAWDLVGPDPDSGEYSYAPGIGLPVCSILPIPDDHSKTQQQIFDSVAKGTVDIGAAMQPGSTGVGSFFHVGPNDRVAVGQSVKGTSADGTAGTFQKIGGVAAGIGGGWYQRTA